MLYVECCISQSFPFVFYVQVYIILLYVFFISKKVNVKFGFNLYCIIDSVLYTFYQHLSRSSLYTLFQLVFYDCPFYNVSLIICVLCFSLYCIWILRKPMNNTIISNFAPPITNSNIDISNFNFSSTVTVIKYFKSTIYTLYYLQLFSTVTK